MSTAVITGASRGLGAAIAGALAERDWNLVLTARDHTELSRAAADHRSAGSVRILAGDVSDAAHRRSVRDVVASLGGLDLLVNNASDLGTTPLPRLVDYPLDRLTAALQTNTVAPLALLQELLPHLQPSGVIVNLTSDAGVAAYEGWGGYGATKAALDQLSAVLAVELPELRVYAFDPGDMRTRMHQEAFPGEDISDRPEPHTVVPALLALLDRHAPSGRYTASSLLADAGSSA